MKRNIISIITLLSFIILFCKCPMDKGAVIYYFIKNNTIYDLKVLLKAKYGDLPDEIVDVGHKQTSKIFAFNTLRPADNYESHTGVDTISVFSKFQILKNDTILKFNFLRKDLWKYTYIGDYEEKYELTIDSTKIK